MSKSMLVTLPFVLLLLDYWPLRRFRFSTFSSQSSPLNPQLATPTIQHSFTPTLRLLSEKLPFFILVILFTVISSRALRAANAIPSLGALSIPEMASNAFISYMRYLGKMFWPLHLAVFYPRPAWSIWLGILSAAAILILSLAALLAGRRWPYVAVGWLWFLGALVPVTAIPLGDHSIADRYTYLPFIGLFLALVWGAVDVTAQRRIEPARFPAILGIAIMAVLALLSRNQVRYWRTSKELFEHVLAVSGESLMVHNDLGVTLEEQGDLAGAEDHFRAAIRLAPSNATPRVNLVRALTAEGKTNEVVAQYYEWLQLSPSDSTARENLGILLAQKGQAAGAVEQFEALVRLRPDAQSHYRLALARLMSGQPEEAIKHYQAAIQLKPDWPEPLNDLAWLRATYARADLRNGAEALQLAERACKLTQFKEARFVGSLDAAYAEAGRFPEAITTAEQARNLALAAGDKTIADLADDRLKLYRAGLPFHQQ
jgi:Flp pilus assembly protein TadD